MEPEVNEADSFLIAGDEVDHVPWDWTHDEMHDHLAGGAGPSSSQPQAVASRATEDETQEGQSPGTSALAKELEEFKDVTGLEEIPGLEEISDLGQQVFGAEMRDQ